MHTTFVLRRRLSQLAVIFPFLAAACSDSIAPPKAATIEASSALDEEAFAGAYVAPDPEVLVRDENGSPIAGVTVKFAVTTGGGSVGNSTTMSGPQGRATAGSWTLGSAPGTNTLVATVDGVGSVVFRVEAVQVPTGRFELMTIDGQPLPLGYVDVSLTAGTFTLDSNGTFTRSEEYTESGQEGVSRYEFSGRFLPHASGGLSFYSGSTLWADGKIEGDTLTLKVNSYDDNDQIVVVTYVYVRADLP